MALRTGNNNATHSKTQNWKDRYSISAAAAADLENVELLGADGAQRVSGSYVGSGAIDTSDYENFPRGSVIIDLQGSAIYVKMDNSTTWKSAALS